MLYCVCVCVCVCVCELRLGFRSYLCSLKDFALKIFVHIGALFEELLRKEATSHVMSVHPFV